MLLSSECHNPLTYSALCKFQSTEHLTMKHAILCFVSALVPAIASANDAVQQIEEIVVTGTVKSNDAIQIAAIDLPGDAELRDLPVISE